MSLRKMNLPQAAPAIQAKESAKIKHASKWARMMVDPSAEQVVAPSYMPRPVCSSSLVHSLDIPYAATNAGYCTIALLPEARATYMVSSIANYPAVGTATLNLTNQIGTTSFGLNGFLTGGIMRINDSGNLKGYVPIPDGSAVAAFRAGQGLVPYRVPLGTTVKIICSSTGTDSLQAFRVYEVDAAGNATIFATILPGRTPTNFVTTIAMEYLMFGLCDPAGAAIQPDAPVNVNLSISSSNAIVPHGTAETLSVVRNQLLDQANVSHACMTSGQMLVTNLASPYDAGGEIVIARVLKKEIASKTTQDLMVHIKSLSEKRMWRSGPLVEGGFAWYLPDDLNSYEPRDIDGNPHSDNVLVACIKMASAQGQIRVNFSTKWDYYTPAQILTKRIGHVWSPASLALLEELAQRDATSGNPTHGALIAAAGALINGISAFYAANRVWLDPVLYEAASQVGKTLADKVAGKPKNKEKRKN